MNNCSIVFTKVNKFFTYCFRLLVLLYSLIYRLSSRRRIISEKAIDSFLISRITGYSFFPLFNTFYQVVRGNKISARLGHFVKKKIRQWKRQKQCLRDKQMRLGVILDQGGSIQSMIEAGQQGRFVNSYLKRYAESFDEVLFFSYQKETYDLPHGCRLIPAKIKTKGIVYSFLMPLLYWREFKKCNAIRVLQMSGAIPAIIGKLIWGIPFVATYGFNYYEKFKMQMYKIYALIMNLFTNIGIKFADVIIVSSKDVLNSVKQKTRQDKVYFIPNGVELGLFRVFKDYNENPKEANIFFIGRLSRDKNLFMLIDALSKLPEKKLTLTIIGNGTLRESLQDYAYQKGVKTIFKGAIPYESLPNILVNADIFVLPSLWEGHPKALTDAMACGIACIGTHVKGTREIIKDGENGLLCELNSDDLAKKIQILLEDKSVAQRLGINARKYVEENYNLERLIKKEIEILLKVAQNA